MQDLSILLCRLLRIQLIHNILQNCRKDDKQCLLVLLIHLFARNDFLEAVSLLVDFHMHRSLLVVHLRYRSAINCLDGMLWGISMSSVPIFSDADEDSPFFGISTSPVDLRTALILLVSSRIIEHLLGKMHTNTPWLTNSKTCTENLMTKNYNQDFTSRCDYFIKQLGI